MAEPLHVKNALIVDDDAEIAQLIAKILDSRGIASQIANSGAEALRLVAQQAPDVVFLDIMMPGMDGSTVLAELRRRRDMNASRIVMVTARNLLKDEQQAKRVGADAYITKPFTMADILAAL